MKTYTIYRQDRPNTIKPVNFLEKRSYEVVAHAIDHLRYFHPRCCYVLVPHMKHTNTKKGENKQ